MALNRFMHPRNRYKDQKPDFIHLALKYPEFKKHSTQDLNGKVTLDFKNPDSVRILTQTLLKEDFELTVDLPRDRLIPTLSSRLNYVHWLEDMFGGKYKNLVGIDIGTGASCIYPLLGCKLNSWSFLATEIDDKNYEYAVRNVASNQMEDKIQVVKVDDGAGLPETIVSNGDRKYDFVMCNPPFFADHMESQAITTCRKVDRPDPPSMSTADDCESITHGGEAEFIKTMIRDSFKLKEKVRIFSSMVGKKINVSLIKEELKRKQISYFSTTEFCQGKTMRWGVAWSFDGSVQFPKSYFEKKKKGTAPLVFEIPFDNGQVIYDIQNITAYIILQLQQLKIQYKEGKMTKICSTVTMTATQNTWSHQRRKRRQEKHGKNEVDTRSVTKNLKSVESKANNFLDDTKFTCSDNSSGVMEDCKKLKTADEKSGGCMEVSCSSNSEKTEPVDVNEILSEKCSEIQDVNAKECGKLDFLISDNKQEINSDKNMNCNETSASSMVECKSLKVESVSVVSTKGSSVSVNTRDHLLKCRIILRKKENAIELEIVDLDKINRDPANQILQYFKNKLRSQT